jgi:PEP-CTERM motif
VISPHHLFHNEAVIYVDSETTKHDPVELVQGGNVMKKQILTYLAAGLAGLSWSQTSSAADPTYGSAAILTNRLCAEVAGTNCALLTPRTFTQFAGGLGTTFITSATNENGSGASGFASVDFGAGYLPTIKVASFSAAQTRTGASADAFRVYTYTGLQAINLALTGSLHYITTGDDGVPGEEAGAGIMNANLAILPVSALGEFGTTAVDIISAPGSGFTNCGGGATGAAYVGSAGTIGEISTSINLATNCAGGAITLHTGDSFIVYAAIQAISNRSGSLDASHTFSVDYDPVKTVFTDTGASVGAAFLAVNVGPAVPEPATWAMMLLGFGTAGFAMRRSKRAEARVAFA